MHVFKGSSVHIKRQKIALKCVCIEGGDWNLYISQISREKCWMERTKRVKGTFIGIICLY